MSPDLTEVNIKSVNGLVPSGKSPLPEPTLTQFYANMTSSGFTVKIDIGIKSNDLGSCISHMQHHVQMYYGITKMKWI